MLLESFSSALLGSSVGIAVMFLALVEGLRRTFATRQDLHGLAHRLAAMEAACLQARAAAEEARERARITQALLEHTERRLDREGGFLLAKRQNP